MSGQPITIRNLGPEDAHILDRVHPDVFDNTPDPSRAWAFLATRINELVVALDAGTVVGFASGTVLMHPDKPTAFFIQEVGVADAYQGQGIATKLMRRIGDLARDRGCEDIWVLTEEGNTTARGLYKKLGGVEADGLVMYTLEGL